MRKRGTLQTVKRPDLGGIALYAGPMRFEGSEGIEIMPGKALGADTDEVLNAVLGKTKAEIKVSRDT